jgi:hypothetical protein
MALCLAARENASPDPGTGVACRCCPAGSCSTRARWHPSDMTDVQWAVIEPFLPAPGWAVGKGGSPGPGAAATSAAPQLTRAGGSRVGHR